MVWMSSTLCLLPYRQKQECAQHLHPTPMNLPRSCVTDVDMSLKRSICTLLCMLRFSNSLHILPPPWQQVRPARQQTALRAQGSNHFPSAVLTPCGKIIMGGCRDAKLCNYLLALSHWVKDFLQFHMETGHTWLEKKSSLSFFIITSEIFGYFLSSFQRQKLWEKICILTYFSSHWGEEGKNVHVPTGR